MNKESYFSLFDNYFWLARVLPAVIALIPLFIFQYVYFENLIYRGLLSLESVPILFKFLINLFFLYVTAQIIRFFGKDLFEKIIFKDGLKFPTTELLMFSNNELTNESKNEIRSKIEDTFKVKLPNKKTEKSDEHTVRKRLNEIVNRIIKKVGYKKTILNNYNTEYGFFRNTIGGMVLFSLFCILTLIFSYNNIMILFYLNILLLLVPFLLILFSKDILNNYGKKYAKDLFDEFMVIEK